MLRFTYLMILIRYGFTSLLRVRGRYTYVTHFLLFLSGHLTLQDLALPYHLRQDIFPWLVRVH